MVCLNIHNNGKKVKISKFDKINDDNHKSWIEKFEARTRSHLILGGQENKDHINSAIESVQSQIKKERNINLCSNSIRIVKRILGLIVSVIALKTLRLD